MTIGRRIVWDLLGFLAAALAASVTVHLLILFLSMLDGEQDVFFGMSVLFTVALGTLVIALRAFLPTMAVIVLAEKFRLRQWYVFTLAGALASLCSAVGIYSLRLVTSGGMSPLTLALMMVAGAVAGFVYRLVAGRSSGIGPDPVATEP